MLPRRKESSSGWGPSSEGPIGVEKSSHRLCPKIGPTQATSPFPTLKPEVSGPVGGARGDLSAHLAGHCHRRSVSEG